jgi:hypothetical protein
MLFKPCALVEKAKEHAINKQRKKRFIDMVFVYPKVELNNLTVG